jgi:hypothetical protein
MNRFKVPDGLYRKIYLTGLALLACSLPLSRFTLSLSLFILALNWLAEGQLPHKTRTILRNPSIWLFASVFLLYCSGGWLSENHRIALMKIINALPLLVLPVVMATSAPLTRQNVKWLLLLFSASTLVAAIICLVRYLALGLSVPGDISVFMSHIRFSFLVVMAIFILLYMGIYPGIPRSATEKIIELSGALALIAFLLFLRSFTGIIIFSAVAIVFVFNITLKSNLRKIKVSILVSLTSVILAILAAGSLFVMKNFYAPPSEGVKPDSTTMNGRLYTHLNTGVMENGHYIDLYVCEPELRKAWNDIGSIPYDSNDHKQQPVKYTLRRYLTSMNLRKDSAGVSQLNTADITAIENGTTNFRFRNMGGLLQRFYETVWEIHIYIKTGYVKYHSFGQRILFYRTSLRVLHSVLWKGTGSGDVYNDLLKTAMQENFVIDPAWEGKPHNQYLFFILAFGLGGMLWIAWCWTFPVVRNNARRQVLFNLFGIIVLLSMSTLDTLESYDSMVFFAFFYSLFVYGTREEEPEKEFHPVISPQSQSCE